MSNPTELSLWSEQCFLKVKGQGEDIHCATPETTPETAFSLLHTPISAGQHSGKSRTMALPSTLERPLLAAPFMSCYPCPQEKREITLYLDLSTKKASNFALPLSWVELSLAVILEEKEAESQQRIL